MKLSAIVAVVAVAGAVFCVGVLQPVHNWDIIGYVAAAHYQDGLRGQALRAATYDEVRAEVRPGMFEKMSMGNRYRQELYQGNALEAQVPFYSVKFLYVEAIRALGKLGISYSRATYLLAALFAALSVAALAALALRARVSLYVVPIVVLAVGYVQLARLSTPDSLAVLGCLVATLACVSGSAWTFVFAAILPAIRPDYVVYAGLLMLVMAIRGAKLFAVLGAGGAILVYVTIGMTQHAYSWLTLLNFTFVDKEPYPSDIVQSLDVTDYLPIYVRTAWEILGSSHFLVYVVCGYVIALFRSEVLKRELHAAELLAVPAVFTAIHVALFPSYQDRFFALPASLILIWLLACLGSFRAQLYPEAVRSRRSAATPIVTD
jgi:hypothetical protein